MSGKPLQITEKFIKNGSEMSDDEKLEIIDDAAYYLHISRNDKTAFFVDNVSSTDSYTLYYRSLTNKNKEAEIIASNITSYQISDNSKRLVYKTDSDKLYSYDLKESTKIADDVSRFTLSGDGKTVVYLKKTNDEDYFLEGNLYIKKGDKEPEKICSKVTDYKIDEKGSYVYFIDSDDQLYQYKGNDSIEITDDAYSILYVYKTGEVFYRTKNEKERTLADYVYDDKKSTDANMSSYSSEYDDKLDRDEIREALEDSTEEITEYSLHYYDGNKDTVLSENVISYNYNYDKAVIAYTEFSFENFEKVKLSEIESEYDIETKVDEAKKDATTTFVAIKNQTNEIEHKEIYNLKISDNGKKIVYLVSTDNNKSSEDEDTIKTYDIYTAKISGKKLGKASVYDTDISTAPTLMKNKLIYFKDVDKDGFGDLYVDKKQIDSDVLATVQTNERTNDIYYFTDYDEENQTLTINKVSGNKGKQIAEDIHDMEITLGGKIFYLTNFDLDSGTGDLYLHKNTGSDKKIDDDGQYLIPHYYHSKTY